MESATNVSALLREVMQERGFRSQKQLAAFLGLGKTKVNGWMQGRGAPSSKDAARIKERTGRDITVARRTRGPYLKIRMFSLEEYARKLGGYREQQKGIVQSD